jgi:cobalt-zinc-cadmium efflux system protein
MTAAHAHHHHDHRGQNKKRLTLALVLAGGYMVAEVVGGLLTNSLALLADAGHMLSDVAALGLSLFAVRLAERPATPTRTYGYHRAEILAALANGATLLAICVFILIEAYERLWNPPDVRGGAMMAVAAGGLGVNLLSLWVLGGGKSESLNMRGAWLHVLTDALGSVGVLVAGALIWAFRWEWADPVASVLISLLVVYSGWHILAEAVSVLMESVPGGINVDDVRQAIRAAPGVAGVHDLHVWAITSGMNAMSVHVIAENGHPPAKLLRELRTVLHDRFGIDHVTIQIEPPGFEEPETHA